MRLFISILIYRSIVFYAFVVFICSLFINGQAQNQPGKPIANPKIVITGAIQDTTDSFGRKRFIGTVVNNEKVRIDFISMEFTLRDREGKILETKSTYIKGQTYRFRDRRQTSTSSLEPGKKGTFDIIMAIPAKEVYSYTYKITGMHFIYP
jgi:hypothetical protein